MVEETSQVKERTGWRRFARGAGLGTYGWLLVAMIATFFLGPLLTEVEYGVRIADIVAVLVVIAAIIAVTDDRRHVYTLAIIALAAVIPQGLDPHVESNWTGVLANIASIGFLGYLLIVILRNVFTTNCVTIDTLVGSVCGYLLIAAIFAAIYSTVILIEPNAFVVDPSLGVDPANLHFQGMHFGVLTYYSVITLTTVGYGDVVPANTITRGLVSTEAVLGQVYLTIIVARLVGLHLTASFR